MLPALAELDPGEPEEELPLEKLYVLPPISSGEGLALLRATAEMLERATAEWVHRTTEDTPSSRADADSLDALIPAPAGLNLPAVTLKM